MSTRQFLVTLLIDKVLLSPTFKGLKAAETAQRQNNLFWLTRLWMWEKKNFFSVMVTNPFVYCAPTGLSKKVWQLIENLKQEFSLFAPRYRWPIDWTFFFTCHRSATSPSVKSCEDINVHIVQNINKLRYQCWSCHSLDSANLAVWCRTATKSPTRGCCGLMLPHGVWRFGQKHAH